LQGISIATTGTEELAELFELAPVSLWLEDYSALREQFQRWRNEGVTDLRAFLLESPDRVSRCSSLIRVLAVNRRTLELFEAESIEHLVDNLSRIFRDDMFDQHVEELVQLWEGGQRFHSQTVNYTLSGRRLDILLHGTVLSDSEESWRRVLVSVEDITERCAAQQAQADAERYARGLFEHSPVSLWVEDFSGVKTLLDEVRATGVTDFRTFTDVHPEIVDRCMEQIRILEVNHQTMTMFDAPDQETLINNVDRIFRDDMSRHFGEQLIKLFNGELVHQRESVNYTLTGDRLNVYLQFSVLPGHEEDWGLVLVSLMDITAHKKAEAYLEFLGTHDPLSKLRNRTFFAEEIKRLDRRGPWPLTVVVIDLNNLKRANDQHGHATGDALIRRAGEVLSKVAEVDTCAARIGGDEFAMLLPGTDQRVGQRIMERIDHLVTVNNSFYNGPPLSFAMGMATGEEGTSVESVVQEADRLMYEHKREYYETTNQDRRGP
jgi:diguanylate cyclase (GGDEF)-like protein